MMEIAPRARRRHWAVFFGQTNGGRFGKGWAPGVRILLTNDDGIYAPGLAAMERQLRRLGEVTVVAPATEQSGVGHSITYLTPLIVKEIFHDGRYPGRPGERWGWAVQGSPADCVKIGVAEFCPEPPELVVSGINSGLNAGINVLYSGTVAAAIEGAFFGITSIAVSMQFDPHPQLDRAAHLARIVIEQILAQKDAAPQLYNMNIPTAALSTAPRLSSVPMSVTRYDDSFEKRQDPWGRNYYWLTGGPPPRSSEHETDLSALAKGLITLTPLDYDLSRKAVLAEMEGWRFDFGDLPQTEPSQTKSEHHHATEHPPFAPGGHGDRPGSRLRRGRVDKAGNA